jgi:hypothetical protein
MKQFLKNISFVALILFFISLIASRITDHELLKDNEHRSFLVGIYLITSLLFYRIDNKEKNAEILDLKRRLNKK